MHKCSIQLQEKLQEDTLLPVGVLNQEGEMTNVSRFRISRGIVPCSDESQRMMRIQRSCWNRGMRRKSGMRL